MFVIQLLPKPQSSLQARVIQSCQSPAHQNQAPSGDTNTLTLSVVPASTFLVLIQFSGAEAPSMSVASCNTCKAEAECDVEHALSC